MFRNELLRLNAQHYAEQHVSTPDALETLSSFGDQLVPGLIECLTDEDSEVREWAVDLLNEVRPRPVIAVPALIARLDEPDRLVKMAVINSIADYGPVAAAAIPYLEPWLTFQEGYLRILAATIIFRLDPNRIELLPDVREALSSSSSNVRFLAREFFQKTHTPLPFDEYEFQETIRRHWLYHSACNQVSWTSEVRENGSLEFNVAPVFQEVWGGEDDGKRVWAGFEIDLYGLSLEPGIEFRDYGAASQCVDHCPSPYVGITGSYFGQQFVLQIHLEPLADSETREIVDVLRNEVRAVSDEDGDS